MQHIELGQDYVLLEKNGKYTPYRRSSAGLLNPTRGRNKNGHLVWRTYSSVEEARENLQIREDNVEKFVTPDFKRTEDLFEWLSASGWVNTGYSEWTGPNGETVNVKRRKGVKPYVYFAD